MVNNDLHQQYNLHYFIAILYELNHTLHSYTNYHYPHHYPVTQLLQKYKVSLHYSWAMIFLLDYLYPSEVERLDKLCAKVIENL